MQVLILFLFCKKVVSVHPQYSPCLRERCIKEEGLIHRQGVGKKKMAVNMSVSTLSSATSCRQHLLVNTTSHINHLSNPKMNLLQCVLTSVANLFRPYFFTLTSPQQTSPLFIQHAAVP